MWVAQDGVGKRQMVSESATPVIDQDVILLNIYCLPNIRLTEVLGIEGDIHQSFFEQVVQLLGSFVSVVYHHVVYIHVTLVLKLQEQVIELRCLL